MCAMYVCKMHVCNVCVSERVYHRDLSHSHTDIGVCVFVCAARPEPPRYFCVRVRKPQRVLSIYVYVCVCARVCVWVCVCVFMCEVCTAES